MMDLPDKQAMTVLGPVPAGELGVTLTHEHLLYDQRQYVLWPPPEEQSGGAIEMRAFLDVEAARAWILEDPA